MDILAALALAKEQSRSPADHDGEKERVKVALYRVGCDAETIDDVINDYPPGDWWWIVGYFEGKK